MSVTLGQLPFLFCLFVCLQFSYTVCLSVRPSVCLSVRSSVCLLVRLSVSSSVCLSPRPCVCLSLYDSYQFCSASQMIKRNHSLFVCLPVFQSFCLSVCHSMKGWLPVLFGLTKSINDNKTKLPRNLTKPLQTLQRFQNALHWKEKYLSIMESKKSKA